MKKLTKDSKIMSVDEKGYDGLLTGVSELLEQARHAAARSVNQILTATYWEIGRRIVEFEQKGAYRAEYGESLLRRLSKDLVLEFGRGFSEENLRLMRLFYLHYRGRISQTVSGKLVAPVSTKKSQTASGFLSPPIDSSKTGAEILQTVSALFPLSWSHYVRLLALDEQAKRDFYEEEARRAGWSVRQLDRQINSMLYERIAISKKKGELLKKAEKTGDRVSAEEINFNYPIRKFLSERSKPKGEGWS